MIKPPSHSERQGLRRPEILVAPVITFLAVCVLLILARFYEDLPVQAPSCQFRSLTGLPCLGCGGTRAMIALASGNIVAAIKLNPAIVLSVFVIAGWLIWRLTCFVRRTGTPPQLWSRKKVLLFLSFLLILFVANWVYLFFYLP